MSKIGPYDKCSCGSGLKYKFCCYLRFKRDTDSERLQTGSARGQLFKTYSDKVEVFNKIAEDIRAGVRLMSEHRFDFAIKCFERACKVAPNLPTGGNNLALSLFFKGEIERAFEVQKSTNEMSDTPNPFGYANLAYFYRYKNEVESGNAALDTALALDMVSVDAMIMVCQVLALYRRHSDIWELCNKYEEAQEASIYFYAGCAAANLGRMEDARRFLTKVKSGNKFGLASVYLQWLRTDKEPRSAGGDWFYLLPADMAGVSHLFAVSDDDGDESLLLVDYCETLLNNVREPDLIEAAIDMLGSATIPEAVELLEKLAFGNFGRDFMRVSAFMSLCMYSDIPIKVLEERKILLGGEWVKPDFSCVKLDDSIRYGEFCDKKLDELYDRVVVGTLAEDTDWKANEATLRELLKQVPDHVSARYNLAITLLHQDETQEPEEILKELVVAHPEYLAARATLLRIFMNEERDEEATALVESTVLPDVTHSFMLRIWMMHLARYYLERESFEEVFNAFRVAYKIEPDHPANEYLVLLCKDMGLGYEGEFEGEFEYGDEDEYDELLNDLFEYD